MIQRRGQRRWYQLGLWRSSKKLPLEEHWFRTGFFAGLGGETLESVLESLESDIKDGRKELETVVTESVEASERRRTDLKNVMDGLEKVDETWQALLAKAQYGRLAFAAMASGGLAPAFLVASTTCVAAGTVSLSAWQGHTPTDVTALMAAAPPTLVVAAVLWGTIKLVAAQTLARLTGTWVVPTALTGVGIAGGAVALSAPVPWPMVVFAITTVAAGVGLACRSLLTSEHAPVLGDLARQLEAARRLTRQLEARQKLSIEQIRSGSPDLRQPTMAILADDQRRLRQHVTAGYQLGRVLKPKT